LAASDTDVHPVVPPLDHDEESSEPDADVESDVESDADGATVTPAPEDDDPVDEQDPVDPDLGSVEEDLDDIGVDGDDDVVPRPRRFTWRVFVFGIALIGLLAATAGAVAWYGRNTYFVSFDADEVVIFKGRPGGFLWFDPTLEERAGIDRRDVPPGVVDEIETGRDQATLDDARQFVANLADQVEAAATTTTTAPTATATADAPGRARAP
jgi:protein phosphatase